ncbi:hypothetical protein ACLESO_52370 [Pyxidicoccus sp. 3LG]
MKNFRLALAFGVLIALALAVGLSTRREGPESLVPTSGTPAPRAPGRSTSTCARADSRWTPTGTPWSHCPKAPAPW